MKKTLYFFLAAITLSSALGILFPNKVAYSAGVVIAVMLWSGLKSVVFERKRRAILWLILATALPFFYSLGWTREISFSLLPAIFIAAFFEEIGWRGFLFKALEKFGWIKMNIVIGLLWTAWHLPAILTGYYPIMTPLPIGFFFFFINLILLSFIFGWFRQKTGGLWAPILLHAFHNFFYGSNEGTWKFSLILIVILLVFQTWRRPFTV